MRAVGRGAARRSSRQAGKGCGAGGRGASGERKGAQGRQHRQLAGRARGQLDGGRREEAWGWWRRQRRTAAAGGRWRGGLTTRGRLVADRMGCGAGGGVGHGTHGLMGAAWGLEPCGEAKRGGGTSGGGSHGWSTGEGKGDGRGWSTGGGKGSGRSTGGGVGSSDVEEDRSGGSSVREGGRHTASAVGRKGTGPTGWR
ncbi:hypothetical protein BS78_01G213400 [Paspalum vaginatum]|nr:hypothetical protein BS78_01G213400 [Paspalum vaginatum]